MSCASIVAAVLVAFPVDPAAVPHLDAWGKAMAGVTNYYAECSLKRTNLLLKKDIEYTGAVLRLKPNRARLRLDRKPAPGRKADPNDYIAYIWDGKTVLEYDGLARQVTEYRVEPGWPTGNWLLDRIATWLAADHLLFQLLPCGLDPAVVACRFEVKLTKVDATYVYLELRPRRSIDRQEFETVSLVLFGPGVKGLEYLPRTMVIRKPNGQEGETWDFPNPKVNQDKLDPGQFEFAPPPDGWKVVRPLK